MEVVMLLFVLSIVCVSPIVQGSIFGNDYKVVLSSNSPVVLGGTVQFTVNVYDSKGHPAIGSFSYEWEDDAIPQNKATHETKSPVDHFNVTYSIDNYPPGKYLVQVVVKKVFFILYEIIDSERLFFDLTKNLNGNLQVTQGNTIINGIYLSSKVPSLFEIILKDSDAKFINSSATSVLTYWFVDCQYSGPSNNYSLNITFNDTQKQHYIDVLLVSNFDPDNITIPTNISSNSSTISISENLQKPLDKNSLHIPYVCQNSSIAPDDKKVYGLFSKNFTVKAPVTNITITGNNWLQHGDMLSLNVKCDGSGMFSYCVHWPKEPYNITGNETCLNPDTSEKCEFPVRHYFQRPQIYTVVVVIFNDVSKIVSPVTVTVYKVNKQAQLSVIIVPVTFSLVAVVIIVFGIAYYLQNRSRFIVEVADFNFGRQYADMEYKTFTERLKESISNALTRTPTPSPSEHSVWPPGQKYGSLT